MPDADDGSFDSTEVPAEVPTSEFENLQALLFETSPCGNLDAIVQHDDRAIYFFLNGEEAFGTRACWVRNLVQAPYVISPQDLDCGLPPLMPRTHCRTTEGQPLPDPTALEIVWLEEGNGAALYENEDIIAIIPPWSGVDGFHGYSAECVAENQLAWPLMDNPELIKRIDNARQFWQQCSSESTHPYARLQPQLMEIFRAQFGQEEVYYAIDGGRFPPRAAALFRNDCELILVSVGMSLLPQPNVEMSVENPRKFRRIELALSIESEASPSELQKVIEQFSGLVAYPWNGFSWFGDGHTCQFTSLSEIVGSEVDSIEFVSDQKRNPNASLKLPRFRDDPINVLWMAPISQEY